MFLLHAAVLLAVVLATAPVPRLCHIPSARTVGGVSRIARPLRIRGAGGGEDDGDGGRQCEWVMRQLGSLRAEKERLEKCGERGGGGGTLSEEDFHLAQQMLLQELR